MRRFLALTLAVMSAALAVSLGAAPLPFPQAESDLHAEATARFGTLPNGLRYVVMPNHEPKARVSLRLLVLAGSFEETESQRGLAHFLEHMAFNGSTHFAPGTLVERLQRLGMAFGADTNAGTSFDHTIYKLELPNVEPATISEGLQILADYSDGLLLESKMVDKERGIILSEKRTRDSVDYRTFVAQVNFMEGDTLVPKRLPIGLEDVIQKSTRDTFVDFYNTWYRPDLLTVIVVGDIDPASIERQIVDLFSGVKARSPEPAPVDLGKTPSFTGVRALFHSEPEAPTTEVVLASIAPYSHVPDTAAQRIKLLPRMLAIEMLNRRLSVLAKKENAPFIRASAGVEEVFNLYRESSVQVACKADQWVPALGVAEQELRRALTFGFQPDELKEAAADFRNDLEQAAKSASTRHSDELAGELADSLVDRDVFTSPADDLALYGPALDNVSTVDCAQALIDAWRLPGTYVFVSGNATIPGDSTKAIMDAYSASRAVALRADPTRKATAWAYSDFGPAGTVASRTHIDDLDFTEVTFANGVQLNLKKTDFEANVIHVSARLGNGQLTEPAATEPGLSAFTSLVFTAGGLGKHSVDDLERILSGKTVGVNFSSVIDTFVLKGDTNRQDLPLELQFMTATLTDPGYRPEALREARKRIDASYIQFAHTEGGPLALQVSKLLVDGDPRFGLPATEGIMLQRNLAEVKAWVNPVLKSGALEVAISGDIDIEATIEAVAKTLGTLPPREPRRALDDLRRVHFPSQPFTRDFAITTQIPKSLVGVYWPTADAMDVHRGRRLGIMKEVLADRLRVRVREQMGGTYSPSVASAASDVFPGYGYMAAIIITDPAKAKEIQDVVVAVAGEMNANGITQDELDRAKNPILKNITETERTNGYWMTVIGRAQERPEVLDWARSRHADFESITKADIDQLAKAYLAPASASRVVIHPYAAPAASPLAVTPPPDGM